MPKGTVSSQRRKTASCGFFSWLVDLGAEFVNVDGFVAEIDDLLFVDGDDEALLGDFLDGMWFLGRRASMPDCRIGAVIMKMISRTNTMSMNGTMLISESEDWVFFEMEAMVRFSMRPRQRGARSKAQLKVFSICAATSRVKVSRRCARLRMFCKN